MNLFHHNADDDLYAAVAMPTPCDGVGPTYSGHHLESVDPTHPSEYYELPTNTAALVRDRRMTILAPDRNVKIEQRRIAPLTPDDANDYETH